MTATSPGRTRRLLTVLVAVVAAAVTGCSGSGTPDGGKPSANDPAGTVPGETELADFLGNDLEFVDRGSFGLDQSRLVDAPDAPGGRLMRVVYAAGSASRRADGKDGGTQAYLRLPAPVDELYLQYAVRFQPGFDFVKGGKLPGLYGGTVTSGQKIPDGTNGLSTRYMWRRGGAGEVYAYLPTSEKVGTSLGRGCFGFVPGQWSTLQQRVQLNTPGQADGAVTVWQDGRQVLTQKGLTFRTTSELKIEGLFFSTFFGGGDTTWATPVDQFTEFADFSISTDPIAAATPGAPKADCSVSKPPTDSSQDDSQDDDS